MTWDDIRFYKNNNFLEGRKYGAHRLNYQVNNAKIISNSKGRIGLLLQRSKQKSKNLFEKLQVAIIKTIEANRPGRKCPWNPKASGRKLFPQYTLLD